MSHKTNPELIALLKTYRDEAGSFDEGQPSSLSSRNSDGDSLLMVAVLRERPAEVRTLLDAGAVVNEQFEFGYSPLHMAVLLNNPDIVEQLVLGGASLDSTDDDGATPLDLANTPGREEVLKRIVTLTKS